MQYGNFKLGFVQSGPGDTIFKNMIAGNFYILRIPKAEISTKVKNMEYQAEKELYSYKKSA